MDVPQLKIIWCDVNFVDPNDYRSIQDEFNETTTASAIESRSIDPIDMAILTPGREELRSNEVPVVTVQTIDDTFRQIEQNQDKKICIICSGTIGCILVPKISVEYPQIHKVYIYAHNLVSHARWADDYITMVRMFNFHTNLLVRLTRDISYDYIEQGQTFFSRNLPHEALTCFMRAQNLEIAANRRDKMDENSTEPDFRERLDQLEGENGLIAQAKRAIRE